MTPEVRIAQLEDQVKQLRALFATSHPDELSNGLKHLVDVYMRTKLVAALTIGGITGAVLAAFLSYYVTATRMEVMATAYKDAMERSTQSLMDTAGATARAQSHAKE